MSGVAVPAGKRADMRRVLAVLGACTVRRHRILMVIVYCFLLIMAALLGTFGPEESKWRADGLGFFTMIANFSIWAGWFARLLLVQNQMTGLRTAGVPSAVRRALLSAAVVTCLFPAAVLLALDVPLHVAFGAPALGALGGLLFSVMPWPAALALMLVPGLMQMFSVYLAPVETWHLATAGVLGIAVLLVCARSFLRTQDPDAIPAWRRPIMLQAPGGMVAWTDPQPAASGDPQRIHEGWLFAMPRPRHPGPHAPRQAINALLAGPMGYVDRRNAMKQWALMAVAVTVLLVIPFRGDTPIVRDALLTGAAVGLLAGGWTLAMRLARQRRRASAELPELALLPGIGSSEDARAYLSGNVMRRLVQLMLCALAALLCLAWLRGADGSHLALIGGLLAGTTAASVLMCAAALAGLSVTSWRMFAAMLPLLVAATCTLIAAMLRIPVAAHAVIWGLIWSALTLAYLLAARVPLRRYRARAHAFLLD